MFQALTANEVFMSVNCSYCGTRHSLLSKYSPTEKDNRIYASMCPKCLRIDYYDHSQTNRPPQLKTRVQTHSLI